MAIDLGELVEAAQGEVSAPGEDLFPNATPAQWIVRLQGAFWTAKRAGMFANYRETDGTVVNVADPTVNLPREDQQIIVMYVAYNAIRNKMLNMKTMIRGQAGPVEGEIQRSANLLVALFKDLSARLEKIVTDIKDGGGTPVYIFDQVLHRDQDLRYNLDSFWN